MGAACDAAVAAVVHRWWLGCRSLTRVCNNNGGCCFRGQVSRVHNCGRARRHHVTLLVICALVLTSAGNSGWLLLLLLAIFKLIDTRPNKPVRERELAKLAQGPEIGLVRRVRSHMGMDLASDKGLNGHRIRTGHRGHCGSRARRSLHHQGRERGSVAMAAAAMVRAVWWSPGRLWHGDGSQENVMGK